MIAMPTPQGRPPYDLDAIVDIAVQTFLERGYDSTSMDQLAHAASIRKPSLYYHVSSKEELLKLGVTRALNAAHAVFDEPGATEGPAFERLKYVLHRTCQTLGEHVAEAALMVRVRGNTDTEQWVLQRRRELNVRVERLIEASIHDGQIHPRTDPRVAARLLLGMITSAVDWYRPGGPLSPRELADQLMLLIAH